jgi:chromosome segregation ATPase
MATEQNEDILSLKQLLLEKDQELSRLREEKIILEENLDEQEQNEKGIRISFQKRIDELLNDIDEKDGAISSEVINSLKEKIRSKDETLTEMREKLNKGGMTINSLHMEIGEFKETVATTNKTISAKTAKIKEMRDENSKLKSSVCELQQKLESVQSPESLEETNNTGGKVQIQVLKKEMDRKNEELMSTRIRLEKCQKELNDSKQTSKTPEQNLHSEETKQMATQIQQYELEKSKHKEVKMELENAQSNLKKVVIAFSCFVLAVILARVFY